MHIDGIVQRLGYGIQRRREHLRYSQRELVEELDKNGTRLHQSTLSKIERGQMDPRFGVLYAISTVLDMSIENLISLGYSEDRPNGA